MPILRYLVGNPASGKTFIRNEFKQDLAYDGDKPFYIHDINNFMKYQNLDVKSLDEIYTEAVIDAKLELLKAITQDRNILAETTYVGFEKVRTDYVLEQFVNRGYTIEVFFIPPDYVNDIKRNKERLFPVPETLFVKTYDSRRINLSRVLYAQSINVISALQNKTIYYHLTNCIKYSNLKKEVGDILQCDMDKELALDTNAIHFCMSRVGSNHYAKNKQFKFKVTPIGQVKRKGIVFYAKSVKIEDIIDLDKIRNQIYGN